MNTDPKGGDPHLSSQDRLILIDGNRRDSEVPPLDLPKGEIGSLDITLPEPTGAETDPGLVAQGLIAERLREEGLLD